MKDELLTPETDPEINWDTLMTELEDHAPSDFPERKRLNTPGFLSCFATKKRKIPLIAAAILLCLLCFCLLLDALDPYDRQILPGISVGGVEVGGMTRREARAALKEASAATLEQIPLTVVFPKEFMRLSPSETKVSLKTGAAVRAAYGIGRFGTREEKLAAITASQAGDSQFVSMTPYLKLDEAYLRNLLSDYAQRYDTDLTAGSWWTEGPMPDLSTSQALDEVECQTLHIKLGLPTARLDQEDAYRKILDVYGRAFSACEEKTYVVRDLTVNILEPAVHPDLQEIYDTLFHAPVDDSLDMVSYVPIPGKFGYSFDRKLLREKFAAAEYGEILSIPMELTEPYVLGDGVYFQDVLGYCETPHTKDENRNHNLKLACQSMDGLILQPGDVFSYNDTLGQRTKENGYKRAGAYSGWELVMSYGGGICQGSTTIYCAALYADLEIVHRKNHGFTVSYVKPGLDATVNWGGPDFQFRNSTHFPIKISAEVSDGFVKVALLGTEERDYYVEMESEVGYGSDAIYCKSYKCKYDRETGELISREMEARSNYMR